MGPIAPEPCCEPGGSLGEELDGRLLSNMANEDWLVSFGWVLLERDLELCPEVGMGAPPSVDEFEGWPNAS